MSGTGRTPGKKWVHHTQWTYNPRDPIRRIDLATDDIRWRVIASQNNGPGKAVTAYQQFFDTYTQAMAFVTTLINRNGGLEVWYRAGPEFTGTKFN